MKGNEEEKVHQPLPISIRITSVSVTKMRTKGVLRIVKCCLPGLAGVKIPTFISPSDRGLSQTFRPTGLIS